MITTRIGASAESPRLEAAAIILMTCIMLTCGESRGRSEFLRQSFLYILILDRDHGRGIDF